VDPTVKPWGIAWGGRWGAQRTSCRESLGTDSRKSIGGADASRVGQDRQADKAQALMKSSAYPTRDSRRSHLSISDLPTRDSPRLDRGVQSWCRAHQAKR
jgi:hypothetical protein